MKLLILTLFMSVSFASTNLMHGFEIDKTETIDAVKLSSGNHKDQRVYEAEITQEFDLPFDIVREVVGSFEERCNSELKDRREVMNKSMPCLQENNSLIESIKISELKYMKSEPFKVKEYILRRRIYNRNYYHHYDLITEREIEMKDGKTVTISIDMLTNREAAKYLGEKPIARDSAFMDMYGLFTIKKMGENKTKVTYRYSSKTDHWLLNKSYITSTFFSSTRENLVKLMNQISIRSKTVYNDKLEEKKKTAISPTVSTLQ